MDEDRARCAMQIILHAGDARLKTMEALKALDSFNVDEAKRLLESAQKDIIEAHKVQTVELQREANGETAEYSVLLTHAQDTCMTVYSEMNIAEHLIELTEVIDKRFKAIEQK